MVKNINKIVSVAGLALMLSGLALGQADFSIVQIPGANPNSSVAINNNGVTVVNSGSQNSSQVSIWSRDGSSQSLGLSGTNSAGAAIDNSQDVVGAGYPDSSSKVQAFIWTPSGGAQWLGSLGGGISAASGINNSGAVVGLSYTGTNQQHAFFWTAANGMQDLTPDLSSIGGAAAMAINSANQVVGYYYPNGSLKTLGFLWTQGGGLQNLGAAGTLAFAVNDAGTVVGQTPVAKGYRQAFSWTQAGGFNDIGTLGGHESAALGINNQGWIVGTSFTASKKNLLHPFLWTPSNGMQDLNTIAHLSSKDQEAYAIRVNDFGVVAVSTNTGGYLLVPTMAVNTKSSVNPSVVGQPVTFTATITSIAGPPPDGETVQFLVSGNVLGTATLTGGVAQITTSTIKAGGHPVIASYGGDANYLAAKSTAFTQVVNNNH